MDKRIRMLKLRQYYSGISKNCTGEKLLKRHDAGGENLCNHEKTI
jgi:hypothetical protein